MGSYLEELGKGKEFWTPGRTITESDVIAFASLSGDQNEVHTNREYARSRGLSGPAPQVLLVMALSSGLIARLGLFEGTAIALRDLEWQTGGTVEISDTIRCRVTIVSVEQHTQETRIVSRRVEVFNQRDEMVQSGQQRIEVARRPNLP